MRASTSCRFCSYWLEGDYATDPDGTIRRIGQGCCDPCSVRRQRAAEEFMRAADAVRVLIRIDVEPPTALINRVRDAENEATIWRVLDARRQPMNWVPDRFRDPRENARPTC